MRFALALMSMSALALELSLMRLLSVRFWHHVAYLVITVALLGFGASGALLAVVRRRVAADRKFWMCLCAASFAWATAGSARWILRLPLEVHFLAWDSRQVWGILGLELLALIPFTLAGAFVGMALMDAPERVSGHYASNLAGSGAGALAAVGLMHWCSPEQLVTAVSVGAYAAALLLAPWRRRRAALAVAGSGVLFAVFLAGFPLRPEYSAYKRITFERAAGAEVLHEAQSPFGRVAVVEGPAVHEHPGLAWSYTGPIPPRVLLLVDGDSASAVYETETREDWRFLDHTTAAAAYALARNPTVCLVGAGGGAGIGLAIFHEAASVTALEQNHRVIEIMRGPLRHRGGSVLDAPGVSVLNREARGHFARADETYDVIQVPPTDAFGAAGGGHYATQESYLYTVESFQAMLAQLNPGGGLAVTVWMQDPPRAGLRAFETLAEAFRRRGENPANRLAAVRSRTTVTVLARPAGIGPEQADAIRAFATARGFDLGYLPGMAEAEANQYHQMDRPHFFEGARALLGPDRADYLRDHLFSLEAPTDDRPFFFHQFRVRRLGEFRRQLGGRLRAFLEPGYLMLVAAFVQGALLALLLVLLPLVLRRTPKMERPGGAAVPCYFLLLGLGFMMLEMSLLGRFILYLADPIYAASVVIAGFLVFAGIGSRISETWKAGETRVITAAGLVASGLGVLYAVGLGHWLRLTQGAELGVRLAVATATIAPLALAMGHLFPSGLRRIGRSAPAWTPWAWAVNGFASVLAAVGTPLLAMHLGYLRVGLAAAGCYLLAALLGRRLP